MFREEQTLLFFRRILLHMSTRKALLSLEPHLAADNGKVSRPSSVRDSSGRTLEASLESDNTCVADVFTKKKMDIDYIQGVVVHMHM